MLATTVADADDPRSGLAAAARAPRASERTEAVQVRRARNDGLSWAEVAAALGLSRRTVAHKHGGRRPAGRQG